MTYPLHLDLAGRRVLIAGGGPVAARRAVGCIAAEADVVLVSPEVCEDVRELVEAGSIRWERRNAVPADVADSWLVHATTGDRVTDMTLAEAAHRARIWCVTAAEVDVGTARTPAVVRRGDVVVGVSSTGDPDPARAARLRSAIATALDTGALPVRRQRRRPGAGRVVLVGGGPGDPGLLTVRGARELADADVVVHDRLGPSSALEGLDEDVVRIDVGKTAGQHPVPQQEINALLVDHARAGARVVRLKGGDPFVFGRGSEEVAACREAGVEVEVVPGVSSAFAVPAAAGIAVTARGVARGVLVLTGHELTRPERAVFPDDRAVCPDDAAVADAARWCARGNTLVVLMGVATLGVLMAGLVAGGLAPSTPVAVVEQGTTPAQRTVRGAVATIAELAAAAAIRAPAVVVVGQVAAPDPARSGPS